MRAAKLLLCFNGDMWWVLRAFGWVGSGCLGVLGVGCGVQVSFAGASRTGAGSAGATGAGAASRAATSQPTATTRPPAAASKRKWLPVATMIRSISAGYAAPTSRSERLEASWASATPTISE